MRVTATDVREVLQWLVERSTTRDRENLTRFGITAKKAFGVSVGNVRLLAKEVGRSHELALAIWETGWLEARMLAAFVDDPAEVTPAQMDRWCRDFDNWGICDTVCFHLFDRTPHAWVKVAKWGKAREEFVKRGSFALLASLALHDKAAADKPFLKLLPLIESAAEDERNFVKKGVSWALRSVGHRNRVLHTESVELAQRLADSRSAPARWVGKDTLRDLNRPLVTRRFK